MKLKTTDLCDEYPDRVQVAQPIFTEYGGRPSFFGRIATLKVFEDNSLVRQALESTGEGHVLVVDGGGSLRCALLGGNLATLAARNGWAGIVVYGCVRDSEEIRHTDLGVRALGLHPRKSEKKGRGDVGLALHFADVTFRPSHFLYADADGIVLSATALH